MQKNSHLITHNISDAIVAFKSGNKSLAFDFLIKAENLVNKTDSGDASLKLINKLRSKFNNVPDFNNTFSDASKNNTVVSPPPHLIEAKPSSLIHASSLSLQKILNKYNGNKYQNVNKLDCDFLLEGNLETVSVVIPVFNRSKILGMTLAALTHQTYPKDLIEVVVVDDGSHEDTMSVIRRFQGLLNISYFWQQDKGYRPGQARTAGMHLSSAENIITLDCDMLPTRGLVAEFMYILNRKKNSILAGPRKYVSTDHLLVEDLIKSPYWIDTLPEVFTKNSVVTGKYMGKKTVDWRHNFYKRTDFLKNSIFPFIAFASGNVAYPKRAFDITGGYDSEFEKWGSEDTEFAYRLFAEGFYFEPVMGALAFHQEPPGGENEVDRATGLTHTKEILKEKCPLFSRDYVEGQTYRISKYCFINAGLPDDVFRSQVSGYKYSDLEINYSDEAKLLALDNGITIEALRDFLANNKSSFIILLKGLSDINIPKIVDEELKKPDEDLQDLLDRVNKIIEGKAIIFWRGAIARFLNFESKMSGDL
jgi:glycosyltransferase involved in cell wall biosynthesis